MESDRSQDSVGIPEADRTKVVAGRVIPGQGSEPGPDRGSGDLTPEERSAKRTQTWIIVGAIVFLVILVAAIVLMASFPGATEVVRDIAIVFVAVETFLIGLAMILLIFQIQVLVQVLRDEIQPLLRSVNDTASTVRGTTEFVSHNMVSPIIKMSGFLAGMRRAVGDAVRVAKSTRSPRVTRVTTSSEQGGNKDVQAGE